MAKLYFYYSSMNAGKSTTLLQSSYNYQERGMSTQIYTALIDDRFGGGKVSSRIGISQDANVFTSHTNLFDDIQAQHNKKKLSCVLIDEAQFLTKAHVFQLTEIVDTLNIPVLCYGLRTDFQSELFEGSRYLLAWADHLKELKTICFCGSNANFTVRVNDSGDAMVDGEQIQVGGNERYLSMCRKHYKEKMGLKET